MARARALPRRGIRSGGSLARRAERLGVGVALALIGFAPARIGFAPGLIGFAYGARAQAPEEASGGNESQSSDRASAEWEAEIARAEGIALEKLVDRMREQAGRSTGDRTGFGISYCNATVKLLASKASDLSQAKDLELRARGARSAAESWGGEEERLRVENEYARALMAEGELERAHSVLAEAEKRFSGSLRNKADLFELLSALASARCDFEEVERTQVLEQSQLDASLAVERGNHPSTQWLPYLLEGAVWLEGDRAQTALQLGLPEIAARRIARQAELVHELERVNPSSPAIGRAAMDRCSVSNATLDFEETAREVDRLLDGPSNLEPAVKAQLLYYKASALSYLADRDGTSPSTAQAILEKLVSDAETSESTRQDALLEEIDIRLKLGDLAQAEISIAELDRRRRETPPITGPCAREEEEARIAAYRARIALKRGLPPAELIPVRDALDRAYARFLDRSKHIPLRRGGIGFLHWPNNRLVVSALIGLELAIDSSATGAARALDVVMRAQELGTLARSLQAKPATLALLREELLGPKTGLILFLPARDRSHLFVIDREHVLPLEIASRPILDRAVAPWLQELAAVPSNSDDRDAHARRVADLGARARELLLPPDAIQAIAGWSGAYVAGTESLWDLPLQALPWNGDSLLGAELALCRLPSVPAGLALAERRAQRTSVSFANDVEIFAAPHHEDVLLDDGTRLHELTIASDDLDGIARPFDASRVALHTAADASSREFARVGARSAAILSVITHGVFDGERNEPAGLVLGGTGSAGERVWSEDIERSSSAPPLVELLACGSGRGNVRIGDDGASHLASAFLRRGSDAVIVGRRTLRLHATLALAAVFHLHLVRDRTSPAEALRDALRDAWHSRADRDPFEASSIEMIGLGHASAPEFHARPAENEAAPRDPRVWLAAVAFALAVGAASFVARRRRRATRNDSG